MCFTGSNACSLADLLAAEQPPSPSIEAAANKPSSRQRSRPAINKNGDKPNRKDIVEISVTIGNAGADLNLKAIEENLQRFIREDCEEAFFAVERGGTLAQLHLQGVVRRYGIMRKL